MKEPYGKGLATHTDPELCAGHGNMAGEASAGAHAYPGIQLPLDALYVDIVKRKVNYVLDADIRGFFDAIEP